MGDERSGVRAARLVVIRSAAFLVTIVGAVNAGFLSQGHQQGFPVWYNVIGWGAGAITLGVGVIAPLLRPAALRVGAGAAAALYVVFVAFFPLAAHIGHVERMPWLLTASSAAVAAALVAGGTPWGWATVLFGACAGVVYRIGFGGFDVAGVINDAHAVLTAAVICVLGGYVLSVGRGLDDAAASRREAGSREYAERGRLAAHTRTAAIVHDEVLATLALAASPLPVPVDRLAAQARRAVTMVTRLVDDDAGEPVPVDLAVAAEARRGAAAFLPPTRGVPPMPAAVREALLAATRQALDNARRHAPDARRSVSVRVVGAGVEVEIADEGGGFDPSRIADDRLGIRQSIVGRMSRVPGGHAHVDSAPGAGTRVVLSWAAESSAEVTAVGDRRSLSRGAAVVTAAFLVLQVVCAVAAVVGTPSSWPRQVAILILVLIAAEALRRSPAVVPSRGRSALIVATVVVGVIVTVVAAPTTYGDLWPVVALAFLLVGLAVRGRAATALAALAVVVGAVVVGGVVDGAAPGQIVTVTARPALIVIITTMMLLVVRRMQGRIAALHREAVAAAEQRSWSLGARAELGERTDELARTVVPLLTRIAEGRVASEADRRDYAALEGALRDGLRAGALAHEPLRRAVAQARGRGVDVVLLDDSDRVLSEAELRAVSDWMVAAVAEARHSVVGRLLPPGRSTAASVTVDGRALVYDVTRQGSESSFHGE
ncbi:ATP-binding protein [Microbacterium trichothecenolyticum]|uniref:Histidine kinase/HSP90-like ATPase domain-containing protein n=1 Tax=Microbacterium trichothecenolyticum TaxID=69370 RepID=A0ABU0TXJ6_MICTR|nr:ATP-binding protein [Microbacterium trichothecenolyticum]MDQ1124371.1 hypothetical protein [Microbacterium trichothecenolyticum]